MDWERPKRIQNRVNKLNLVAINKKYNTVLYFKLLLNITVLNLNNKNNYE